MPAERTIPRTTVDQRTEIVIPQLAAGEDWFGFEVRLETWPWAEDEGAVIFVEHEFVDARGNRVAPPARTIGADWGYKRNRAGVIRKDDAGGCLIECGEAYAKLLTRTAHPRMHIAANKPIVISGRSRADKFVNILREINDRGGP